MALKAVQMLFVALGAVGLIGVIICCALPQWTVVHDHDMEFHTGLWKACVKYRTGPQGCRTFDGSIILISSEFHAYRAMTVISCMLGILSLLLLFFGADFTTCVRNKDTKPKMILAAGVMMLLAGLLVIIPVSWWTNDVRNAPVRKVGVISVEVILGASIYIGFIAGFMLMLIGVLLCYLSRSSSSGGTASFSSNRV